MRCLIFFVTVLTHVHVANSQEATQIDNVKSAASAASQSKDPERASQAKDDKIEDGHRHGPKPGPQAGRGFRGGRGPGGPGRGGAGGFRADMMTIHSMFDDRKKIRRTVRLLPDGAETLTESDNRSITEFIQDHVPNMDRRVVENDPLPPMTFHPVFVSLIRNSDKYTLKYEETDKGIKVTYQSDDPFVVMLVQEHAKLVSRFIENGHSEIHADDNLPQFSKKKAMARAKALTARGALFRKLSGRLTEVIKAEGPAAAIKVCSSEASQIAESVGKAHGVRIGRTAVKLRNEKNAPPQWAKALVKEATAHGTFVDLPGNRMGALLPIRLQKQCTTCHGPAQQIAPAVAASLTKFYPRDQATGFREGDLRGWFWVEVPAE